MVLSLSQAIPSWGLDSNRKPNGSHPGRLCAEDGVAELGKGAELELAEDRASVEAEGAVHGGTRREPGAPSLGLGPCCPGECQLSKPPPLAASWVDDTSNLSWRVACRFPGTPSVPALRGAPAHGECHGNQYINHGLLSPASLPLHMPAPGYGGVGGGTLAGPGPPSPSSLVPRPLGTRPSVGTSIPVHLRRGKRGLSIRQSQAPPSALP